MAKITSIYPSIPMPGTALPTLAPAVEALRQTVNLIILNGLSPNPNYTPSETAQVFVTYAAITKAGITGPRGPAGPAGPPGAAGVPEAPNDVNVYGRHALGWQNLAQQAAAISLPNVLTPSGGTYLMQGLNLAIQLLGTKYLVGVSGTIINSAAGGETNLALFYGTGNAPAYGSPVTGTGIGSQVRLVATGAGNAVPFNKTFIIQSVTPGVSYWFDLAARALNGNGAVTDLDFMLHGIP